MPQTTQGNIFSICFNAKVEAWESLNSLILLLWQTDRQTNIKVTKPHWVCFLSFRLTCVFVFMYERAPHACIVPTEARKEIWSYRQLWATQYECWEPSLDPLEEKVLIISEPSLTPICYYRLWFEGHFQRNRKTKQKSSQYFMIYLSSCMFLLILSYYFHPNHCHWKHFKVPGVLEDAML